MLERIDGIKCRITEHNKTTKDKTYTLFRLSTNRHPWFTELRNDIYSHNRIKLFPKEYIDRLSLLGLFFLYLDDGTLRVRYYEG